MLIVIVMCLTEYLYINSQHVRSSFTFVFYKTAYHDCIGPNGCDGCINLENENTNGLEGIINRLSSLRQSQAFTVN